MQWKIRESDRGFYAERGIQHSGGVEVGYMPGVTMPAFIVYESARFDTRKQAEKYIASRAKLTSKLQHI